MGCMHVAYFCVAQNAADPGGIASDEEINTIIMESYDALAIIFKHSCAKYGFVQVLPSPRRACLKVAPKCCAPLKVDGNSAGFVIPRKTHTALKRTDLRHFAGNAA